MKEMRGQVNSDKIRASIDARLLRGEIIAVGSKLFGLCRDCGSIVRIDKPVLGSFHLCTPKKEDT